MSTFRDLVNSVREQWDTAVAEAQGQGRNRAPIRPTSLDAAGSTGASDADRARMRQSRTESQQARTTRDNLYPEGPAPNDQSQRQRRRPVVETRKPRTDSRAALLIALRSPASLRTAILVKEVLDPPVALRGDDSPSGGRYGVRQPGQRLQRRLERLLASQVRCALSWAIARHGGNRQPGLRRGKPNPEMAGRRHEACQRERFAG